MGKFPLPRLQKLGVTHNFGEALAALINAAADGTIQSSLDAIPTQIVGKTAIPFHWRIEVIFRGPAPQATIEIAAGDVIEKHHYSQIPSDLDDILKWAEKPDVKRDYGDLVHLHVISAKTILAMGELLNS